MATISDQERILAQAIFEIRVLLSSYLGDSNEGHMALREAANLAYALHNQALASVAGTSFNTAEAFAAIARVDTLLNTNLVARFEHAGVVPGA